jgi:hypothetical protein
MNSMSRDASANPRNRGNSSFDRGNNVAASKPPPMPAPPLPREAVGAAAPPKPPKPAAPPTPPAPRAYYPPPAYVPRAPVAPVGAGAAWVDNAKTWWEARSTGAKVGIGVAAVGVPIILLALIVGGSSDGASETMEANEVDALEKDISAFARETRAEIRRLDAAMDQTEIALEKEGA